MRARHNLPQHQILRDPQAYIRNIGKYDRANTLAAFKDGGENTVLRACIAPGEGMPLRALGYYAILEHLNRVYFPKAEAQLVIAINTADRVNGHLEHGSRYESAQQFIEHAALLPPHPEATKKPLLLFDNDDHPSMRTAHLRTILGDILHHTPEGEQLKQQAERRGADHLSYLAAHLVMHDTIDNVHAIDYGAPAPALSARRLISVGGRAEETFYKARHHAKAYRVHIPNQVEQTGQLFTRHDTVPSYQFARQPAQGEPIFDPVIAELLAIRDPLLQDERRVDMSSTLRDLAYLRDYVDCVSAAETAFTEPRVLAGYV